jgi:CO/xanthine dehydrogenase Mo-binding subunit
LEHLASSADRFRPPDPDEVDSYIAIHADNTATIYSGYVELGRTTALRQIAAEELDLDLEQVKTATVDTHVSTDGSTLAGWGGAIGGTKTAPPPRRVACCWSSRRSGSTRRSEMTVAKGVVSVGGDT